MSLAVEGVVSLLRQIFGHAQGGAGYAAEYAAIICPVDINIVRRIRATVTEPEGNLRCTAGSHRVRHAHGARYPRLTGFTPECCIKGIGG